MLALQRLSFKAFTPILQRTASPSPVAAAPLSHALICRYMSTSLEKPSHPEFHRHSTRYCDSNRDILNM
jgi:hypothetical protein